MTAKKKLKPCDGCHQLATTRACQMRRPGKATEYQITSVDLCLACRKQVRGAYRFAA